MCLHSIEKNGPQSVRLLTDRLKVRFLPRPPLKSSTYPLLQNRTWSILVQTSREVYAPPLWCRRLSVDWFTSGDERRFPVGQDLGRSGIQRLQDTALDLLHVNIPSGLDARMAERPLGILESPVTLKMSAQRSAHHLKRQLRH